MHQQQVAADALLCRFLTTASNGSCLGPLCGSLLVGFDQDQGVALRFRLARHLGFNQPAPSL
jgi:hypothetical protein